MSEMLLFQHWVVTVQLLKLGIPYESIKTFTVEEIYMIIASEMAIQQKQQDQQAREMAMSNMSSKIGGF